MVAQTKKTLKLAAIIVAVLLVLTVAVGITAGGIAIYNNLPSTKYSRAVALMEEKDYREAELIFHEIEGYKNAAELEIECRWREALEVYLDGNYQRANTMFAKLSQGGLFEPGYVSETIDNYWLEMAAEHISHWELEEALEVGEKSDRERVRQQIRSMLYEKALYCIENDILSRATEIRDLLGDYKDLPQRVEQARQEASYERAVELFNEGEYEDALDYFLDLGDFKDSLSYIESNYKQVRTEEKVTSYTFDEKKEKQKHLSSVTYKLTYNSDGQLTRKESDGLIYEYFYENGLLKQENLTFKNGNAWFKYRYEYEFDDADRMVKKSQICYEEQGGSATDLHWTYVYDREGRLITETKLREQSNVDNYCYHYTYDREGRIKQVVVDYLDMEGKPVTEAMYTIDYTYDDQGRLIKVYNNEGYYNTLFYELDTKEYTYDDRGNLVKEDWYHGNWKAKTVYQSYCYEYTYQWVYDGEQT